MSEREEHGLDPEEEPKVIIHFEAGEFEATRDNTSMFRHIGRLAMYDHVFMLRDAETGHSTYVFKTHAAYEELSTTLMDLDYPSHNNLRSVAECDVRAYDTMIHKDAAPELDNGVPDDWLK